MFVAAYLFCVYTHIAVKLGYDHWDWPKFLASADHTTRRRAFMQMCKSFFGGMAYDLLKASLKGWLRSVFTTCLLAAVVLLSACHKQEPTAQTFPVTAEVEAPSTAEIEAREKVRQAEREAAEEKALYQRAHETLEDWAEYQREQEDSRRGHQVAYRQEPDVAAAYDTLCDFAVKHPEILEDVKTGLAILMRRGSYDHQENAAVNHTIDLWEKSNHDPIYQPLLEGLISKLKYRVVHDDKLDLTKRYLQNDDYPSPYYCASDIYGRVNNLVKLYQALGNREETRFWTLRSVDQTITHHHCDESEGPSLVGLMDEAYDKAYAVYKAMNDPAGMQACSRRAAGHYLQIYHYGEFSEASGKTVFPAYQQEILDGAQRWLEAQGLGKQAVELRIRQAVEKAAERAKQGKEYAEAAKLYAKLGKADAAKRMQLLTPVKQQ